MVVTRARYLTRPRSNHATASPAKAEPERFFDRVNHDILMARLARRVADKRLLRIVRRFLEAGLMQNGVCVERHEGTPQGGPLSPLLANLLLDDGTRSWKGAVIGSVGTRTTATCMGIRERPGSG